MWAMIVFLNAEAQIIYVQEEEVHVKGKEQRLWVRNELSGGLTYNENINPRASPQCFIKVAILGKSL